LLAAAVEVLNNDVEKEPRLLAILQAHFARANPKQPLRIVVFALYKKEAVRLELLLRKAGYKVAGLHGDMLQAERSASLEAFKKAKVNVLVATGQSFDVHLLQLRRSRLIVLRLG
jgi:ATP-dependent RNA helicase DBP3